MGKVIKNKKMYFSDALKESATKGVEIFRIVNNREEVLYVGERNLYWVNDDGELVAKDLGNSMFVTHWSENFTWEIRKKYKHKHFWIINHGCGCPLQPDHSSEVPGGMDPPEAWAQYHKEGGLVGRTKASV